MWHYILKVFYITFFLCLWNGLDAQSLVRSLEFIITDGTQDSWSVNWVDFDNDGLEDLFISSYDSEEPNQLFRNTGFGFENYEDTELNLNNGTISSSWADCNGDGLIDIILSIYKDLGNQVLINNCNGSFHLRTDETLAQSVTAAHGVSWADADNDGDLDAYICSYDISAKNELVINRGDCTFEKHNPSEDFDGQGRSIGAIWADVNNDRLPDLFLPNTGEDNILYINLGENSFDPIPVNGNLGTVGAAFGDLDNDGDLDLIVANASFQNNHLYRNESGNFILDSTSIVSNNAGDSHGISIADFDNDGWQDIIVTNDREGGNFLYWNDGTGEFYKDTLNAFESDTDNSFGIANADFDNDGDLDICIANHSYQRNYFYQNDITETNWMKIDFVGTISNKSAIGTRVEIFTSTESNSSLKQIREVSSQSTGGPGSQSSLTQHFGLGNVSYIDSVTILWPSGQVQSFYDLAANSHYILTEGEELSLRELTDPYKSCEEETINECDILLYPNPGLGLVNLSHSGREEISWLTVYDIYGRLVYSNRPSGDIDLSFLDLTASSGKVYFLHIESSCGKILKKYIKQ